MIMEPRSLLTLVLLFVTSTAQATSPLYKD